MICVLIILILEKQQKVKKNLINIFVKKTKEKRNNSLQDNPNIDQEILNYPSNNTTMGRINSSIFENFEGFIFFKLL